MKLRCNVHDDAITEEKCDVWHRVERCSLIIVLGSVLFWMTDFWQIDYTVKMMFCDISDAATAIKWAFLIRSVNNDLSATWESESRVQKGGILLLERLSKYNHICVQWWDFCCWNFCMTMLFRVCTSLLLCRHFVDKFILRHSCFLCIIFIFVLSHFWVSFQWSKCVNNVTYNAHCVLHWLSSYRLSLQDQF